VPVANQSWAPVTMGDRLSVDRVLKKGVTAGSAELKLYRFTSASNYVQASTVSSAANDAAAELIHIGTRISNMLKRLLGNSASAKKTLKKVRSGE
jgi:hypothetical protein